MWLPPEIDEPEPAPLFVRFDFETLHGDAAALIDERYSSFAKQTYVEADIDFVSIIRGWRWNGWSKAEPRRVRSHAGLGLMPRRAAVKP